MDNPNRCKLPAINNGIATMSPICKPPIINPSVLQVNCEPSGTAVYNARTSSYINSKLNCPSRDVSPTNSRMCNDTQQVSMNKDWSSKQYNSIGKMSTINPDIKNNLSMNQNLNCSPRQKTVVRDRHLANEILQKAGISSTLTPNDCLEVITDTPVTMNDPVNCDPNPLCMKKSADCQECYEQSIIVRHLQPPRPPVPAPIIIRERCAPQPPPQPPIVIRQIPPRPCTPPVLIIRECPPPMPDIQEPTIIEREVPPPPPPPRQVIVERLPTPPPKPRRIIFEKWLPYEEPVDRPCIVEKAVTNEMPPPKNVIIQYEALEPKIQPQCINEGISYVDPKQFVNEQPNGNAEVCYVDQLNNLPDHIKCQLSSQTLAAIGIKNDNKINTKENSFVARTNPTPYYQQNSQRPCHSISSMLPRQSMMVNNCQSTKPSYFHACNPNIYREQQANNRALSTSATGLSQCFNKYNTNILARQNNQGITNCNRAQYNPWATTYQVSYTNKARGLCRAR
ncbi:hypothetical protein I4U23_006564 [Adineta vaga]|nr:hypothetical protein I4U23_006564 [Adineta vaga]